MKTSPSITTIFFKDSFDAAHHLPHVPTGHKCARVHGHTYRVRIEIFGQIGKKTGWIIDYTEVKAAWALVKDMLDHRDLNYYMENPTCEIIAQFIADHLTLTLPPGAKLHALEICETENCGVRWQVT